MRPPPQRVQTPPRGNWSARLRPRGTRCPIPIPGTVPPATESAGSREESWPRESGNSSGGPRVAAASATSAGRMSLREVARDSVYLVAEKMKVVDEEVLEGIKAELRSILETGSSHNVEEFLYLQKLVHDKADLTLTMLSMAHHVQLEILVTIKTGIQAYLHPSVKIHQSRLAEVFWYKRCRNIACQSALPAEDCRCSVCSNRNGFCNLCMCVICNKFDFEVNTCRWIGCDACSHWTHADCAIRDGQIGTGQTMKSGVGHTEMLLRCRVCQMTTELLSWARDVFQQCAPGWNRDDLLRELDYVCKIFRLSGEDSKGRKLFSKCADMIERLISGFAESISPMMLLQALQEMDDQENEEEALDRVLIDASAEPIKISYELLEKITRDFSQVIGSGGYGVVYMGVLRHKKVAVKKLFQMGDFSDKQFEGELTCLRRVKHKNIVRFLGYCSDTQQKVVQYNGKFVLAEERRRFLCFEYVPNQSLHEYLKDGSHGREWDSRYQLIKGICEGLRYLHNVERINHLDLKPENILLDAVMVPKITDFGLSRCFSGDQSRVITKNICGSRGYIAPEYRSKGEISFKADIFSLGNIISKLLWGNNDLSDPENWHQSLDISNPQVKRCIEIEKLCVDEDQYKRPTIDCIIDMLGEKESV